MTAKTVAHPDLLPVKDGEKGKHCGALQGRGKTMNQQEFVDAIKIVVRDGAASDTLKVLQTSPGRRPSDALKARSAWFRSLDDNGQRMVAAIVFDAAERATFGFLCVLDGVRAIEAVRHKDELELRFLKEEVTNLTPADGPMLHDLW